MSDKKISQLTELTTPAPDDELPIVDKDVPETKRIKYQKLNPMTTAQDLIKGGAGGAPTRLAKGAEGKVLGILSGILAWISAGASAFLGLSDTPADYTDQAGKYIKVNAGEAALEFTDPPATGFTSKARAYRATSNQYLGFETPTKIELNAENYDVDGEFDHVTNFRFTAEKAGYYLVIGNIRFVSVGDGNTCGIYIKKNGDIICINWGYPGSAGNPILLTSTIVYLDVDDFLELWGERFPDGDVSFSSTGASTYMAIHRLS